MKQEGVNGVFGRRIKKIYIDFALYHMISGLLFKMMVSNIVLEPKKTKFEKQIIICLRVSVCAIFACVSC